MFKSKYFTFALVLAGLFSACTDELTLDSPGSTKDRLQQIDMNESLMIPLAISGDSFSTGTRAEDSSLQNGSAREHAIDFDIDKECFAIFFDDEDNFMYVRTLYQHDQLGVGETLTGPNDIGEYRAYAVAYIKKPADYDKLVNPKNEDGSDKKEDKYKEDLEEAAKLLPAKVLVVLNGGRVHDALLNKFHIQSFLDDENYGKLIGVTESGETVTPPKAYDFLYFTWSSELSLSASNNNDDVIGINNHAHFTMTNSAYYGPEEEFVEVPDEEGSESKHWETRPVNPSAKNDYEHYELKTIVPINKACIVDAMSSNITPKNAAATIYVERMAVKFSAPKFSTDVIGSDRIFRPSQNSQSVVIYSWNKDGTLHAEDTNWRIHLIGWTINGREKENFLFKHIQQAWDGSRYDEKTGVLTPGQGYTDNGYLENWKPKLWNDYGHRRSYWSVDPHYDNDYTVTTENGNITRSGDFYPWQYRAAVDRQDISYTQDENNVALRYMTFNQVNYWEEGSLTISENTFHPYKTLDDNGETHTPPFNVYNKPNYKDSRASLLMGPHLLVTARILLSNDKAEDDDYIGQFSRVEDLYGDRYFRYFKTKMDCFRLFVKDINDALRTQHNMSFKMYSWSSTTSGNDNASSYTAVPSGKCALMFDCELEHTEDYELRWTQEDKEIYKSVVALKALLHNKRVADCFDILEKHPEIPLFMDAHIKDGDSRIIPWIPGMVFRNVEENKTDILEVRRADGSVVTPPANEQSGWTNNMRKSLIYEWFGPIDHYANGFMYYAADIPHYIVDRESKEGYYGTVRNHWYTFTITAINSLGTPVDDPNLKIIPARYNYRDQISVNIEPFDWHIIPSVDVAFPN
ncbi:MAG: Mfa1 fimbrilin C-terminal domain-containing protein [Muribaculaceae bacterium]|nr:Mfa1 fimbrilin C-terminal domain-containing protein [Muribaculaceae bacterium]